MMSLQNEFYYVTLLATFNYILSDKKLFQQHFDYLLLRVSRSRPRLCRAGPSSATCCCPGGWSRASCSSSGRARSSFSAR